MSTEEFIENRLFSDLDRLMADGLHHIALVVMTQSVELFGAFLDNKPFRARGQSKERFERALKHLFPVKYFHANIQTRLYESLRSQVAHILIPSPTIRLAGENQNDNHLKFSGPDKVLLIHAGEFASDLKSAWKKVRHMQEKGLIKVKQMDTRFFD
jgi:hypothetical protein